MYPVLMKLNSVMKSGLCSAPVQAALELPSALVGAVPVSGGAGMAGDERSIRAQSALPSLPGLDPASPST